MKGEDEEIGDVAPRMPGSAVVHEAGEQPRAVEAAAAPVTVASAVGTHTASKPRAPVAAAVVFAGLVIAGAVLIVGSRGGGDEADEADSIVFEAPIETQVELERDAPEVERAEPADTTDTAARLAEMQATVLARDLFARTLLATSDAATVAPEASQRSTRRRRPRRVGRSSGSSRTVDRERVSAEEAADEGGERASALRDEAADTADTGAAPAPSIPVPTAIAGESEEARPAGNGEPALPATPAADVDLSPRPIVPSEVQGRAPSAPSPANIVPSPPSPSPADPTPTILSPAAEEIPAVPTPTPAEQPASDSPESPQSSESSEAREDPTQAPRSRNRTRRSRSSETAPPPTF